VLSELAAADVAAAQVGAGGELPADVAELAHIAIGIARRVGRVTSVTLGEAVPLETSNARRLLQGLVDRGELSRRGRTRGTYYVIADPGDASEDNSAITDPIDPETQGSGPAATVSERDAPVALAALGRAESSDSDLAADDLSEGLTAPSPHSLPPPSWPPTRLREPAASPTTQLAREALRRLLRRK
jgi:hypothetical protein